MSSTATAPISPLGHEILRAIFFVASAALSPFKKSIIDRLKGPQHSSASLLRLLGKNKFALVAAGFGTHLPTEPQGTSNAQIAHWIEQTYHNLGYLDKAPAEMYVQWDIAQGVTNRGKITKVIGKPGETHIPTQRFLVELHQALSFADIRHVVIVGQELHAERIRANLVHMGYFAYVHACSSKVPYDNSPQNIQWWCVEKYYYLWEMLCRILGNK